MTINELSQEEVTQIPIIDDGTKKNDDRYSLTRKMLGQIPYRGHIEVTRYKPEAHKGYLGRIEWDPENPWTLEDLRDTWGGRTLNLRAYDEKGAYLGSSSVHFDDDPKKDGKYIRDEADEKKSNNDVLDFMRTMYQQQQALMQTLLSTALEKRDPIPAPIIQPPNGLDDLERVGKAISTIESIRSQLGPVGGSDDNGMMTKALEVLINAWSSHQQSKSNQQAQKKPVQLIHPISHSSRPPNQQKINVLPVEKTNITTENIKNNDEESKPTILQSEKSSTFENQPESPELSEPLAKEETDLELMTKVSQRFSKMNDHERQIMFQGFVQSLPDDVFQSLFSDQESNNESK